MRVRALTVLVATVTVAGASAQQPVLERLPRDVLDVAAPAARVRGLPGAMTVVSRPCHTASPADIRRRIVDITAQEWGFFGFRLAPATDGDDDAARENGLALGAWEPRRWRRPPLPPDEAARVASSIAGYWAVTPEGAWIVGRQNERWKGPDGIGARWNAPWSAGFISWVMCEAGLGAAGQFERAVAHHAYIDQAIRARDGRAPQAEFVAHDLGEAAIAPGDLLCSSRRPAYLTIADRRRQLGVGARSHCDIVVKVDEGRARILAIGGNVRGVVSLKQFPARQVPGTPLALDQASGERRMFAHLKLRQGTIAAHALDRTPTIAASQCGLDNATPPHMPVPLAALGIQPARC
jgi:hypothetical protein